MKILSIGLVVLGIVWALIVVWIHLVMTGITEPISRASVFFYFGAGLIGPVLLFVGPILVLNGSYGKLGAIMTLFGCAILTVYVGYGITGLFYVEPLQAKPSYTIWAVIVIFTVLCDLGAFRLYQLASSAKILHGG